jgi:hypothetical protein
VYAALTPGLTTVQQFLRRCYKRRYISYIIDIYDLLEKTDRYIYKKISRQPSHALYGLLPKVKESSWRLRTHTSQLPRLDKERFKASFINRLHFR